MFSIPPLVSQKTVTTNKTDNLCCANF